MKVVITGHTYGLGKALYEHFPNAKGISRSTGLDIEKDFDAVVKEIKGCDLFINNAYANHSQVKLFHAVKDNVSKIICMGSLIRLYANTEYAKNKQDLYDTIRRHNFQPNSKPVLHLDIGFLEKQDNNDPNVFLPDNFTTYKEILSIIDYWLVNPFFNNIEFNWKMTPKVAKEFQQYIK